MVGSVATGPRVAALDVEVRGDSHQGRRPRGGRSQGHKRAPRELKRRVGE